jgi:hypothetical protein
MDAYTELAVAICEADVTHELGTHIAVTKPCINTTIN